MLSSLHWRSALNSPEARGQLHELRADTLRLFVVLAAVGYLVWQFSRTFPNERELLRSLAVAPAALVVLGGTYTLLPWSRRVATSLFVVGGLAAVAWTTLVLDAAEAAMLYVVLALTSAFVVHPLGGIAVVAASAGLLAGLDVVRPGLIGPDRILQVAAFSGVAVAGVWALMHRLFLALNWYAAGYAEAEARMREAREHRAQLVQAWKQLDVACARLERANAALQLAWKAADEAERAKMELATNISHELRTPLNLIVGYSEMMMTSPGSYGGVPLPAEYRGDVGAIYRGAQHLLSLTDDVLELAQMEADRLGLVREPIDLRQIVRDAAALVRDYVEARGSELRLQLPRDLPAVSADRLRIRQVLLNLLTNAARFTEQGRLEARVLLRDEDVLIEVRDTGPGIAAEELERVFQPFVSRGERDARWRSGTGLGLPISKRFVELHGGEMGVRSAPGQGTTFWFTLPVAPAEGGAAAAVPSPRSSGLRPAEQVLVLGRGGPALARLLQRHMDGFRVEPAAGPEQAVPRAVELRASGVILDAADEIEPGACPVPVVRCPLPRAGRLARSLGVADYLVKPVPRDALLQAIAALARPVERILVVDDDARFARFVTRMLAHGGSSYIVRTAHDGAEALERMRTEPPDVVLLDLTMPVLDGRAVIAAMAQDARLRDAAVIVLSAHGEGEDGVPLGAELHISKPDGFRLAELARVIGAAVSAMAPARALVAATEPAPAAAPPA